MIGYASNTGTKRNLEALRKAGWRIMLTPDNPTPREALPYAIDNGHGRRSSRISRSMRRPSVHWLRSMVARRTL